MHGSMVQPFRILEDGKVRCYVTIKAFWEISQSSSWHKKWCHYQLIASAWPHHADLKYGQDHGHQDNARAETQIACNLAWKYHTMGGKVILSAIHRNQVEDHSGKERSKQANHETVFGWSSNEFQCFMFHACLDFITPSQHSRQAAGEFEGQKEGKNISGHFSAWGLHGPIRMHGPNACTISAFIVTIISMQVNHWAVIIDGDAYIWSVLRTSLWPKPCTLLLGDNIVPSQSKTNIAHQRFDHCMIKGHNSYPLWTSL